MTKQASPTISNIRAIVTTKWGRSGYRPVVVRNIERYYVDTALDNDADAWQVEIGDLKGDLLEVMQRDNEVRVQLFGYSPRSSNFIMTGIADNIEYDESGTLVITGRDLSSLATDTLLPPTQMRHVRAYTVVKRQATRLGFKRVVLAQTQQSFKRQYTDGSESYWEFWYRLYRKEKQWIWTEPDGTLRAGGLNYEEKPSYYFGIPSKGEAARVRNQYLPIEHIAFSKDTTRRLGHVWVYGHHGDNGIIAQEEDPHTRQWVKRPLKIMLDTDAISKKSASKMAWEEIFEGKVGELEVRITLADPGYEIKQNRVAVVRIPEIDYANTMFIVGVRRSGSGDGVVLEVRLREKNYAISRRVPQDPKVPEVPPTTTVSTTVGDTLGGMIPNHPEWAPFFVKAAQKYSGAMWDYALFLATLIAICDQETGGKFVNIRRDGGPGGSGIEWYQWNGNSSESPNRPASPRDDQGRTLEEWRTVFANVKGQYVSEDYAVGPMQLLSIGYKHFADDLLEAGNHDQFNGGRWTPEYNIMAGGYALRDKLKTAVGDSGREIDMWVGVAAYGEGASYAQSVKSKVYNTYLPQVQEALKAAKEAAKAARDGQTDPSLGGDVPENLPTANQIQAFYATYNSRVAPDFEKRQAIQYAAMWGVYNADSITYGTDNRMGDFAPPPNVPGNTDCSGYSTWCYKAAGAPDPNGNGYNGIGYTGTQWTTGKPVSYAGLRPGDLVFYGNPMASGGGAHVAVYVGKGKVASMGSTPGPFLLDAKYRSDFAGCRTFPT